MAGILLIEDDAAARHMLRVLLERDSHTVWEAASPDEGWKVLEETATPDLAIVDLRLGEATGIDLMRRLRSDAIWAALPVVLCSATPDRESVLSSVQLGAAAFLTKPYDALRIRAAVAKALATKWTRKHFEDPVTVTRRLSTDRDHVAQVAKKFFAELQAATRVVVETEEERKTALVHLVSLRRTAADLGFHSIELALADWEKAGGGQEAAPEAIRRTAVLARLFGALGI
ncbi:MAG TPA: response regulator [Opitutaceae bacterium]|nr:response regulator [Opitutaceae bacterium]